MARLAYEKLTQVRNRNLLSIVPRDDNLTTVYRKGRGIPAQTIRIWKAHTTRVSNLLSRPGFVGEYLRYSLAFARAQRELGRHRHLDRQARGLQLRETLESLLTRIGLNKRVPA